MSPSFPPGDLGWDLCELRVPNQDKEFFRGSHGCARMFQIQSAAICEIRGEDSDAAPFSVNSDRTSVVSVTRIDLGVLAAPFDSIVAEEEFSTANLRSFTLISETKQLRLGAESVTLSSAQISGSFPCRVLAPALRSLGEAGCPIWSARRRPVNEVSQRRTADGPLAPGYSGCARGRPWHHFPVWHEPCSMKSAWTGPCSCGSLFPHKGRTSAIGGHRRRGSGWRRWNCLGSSTTTMIPIPRDFRDFITLLNERRVRYVIVGGYAVAYHGHHGEGRVIDR